MTNHLLLPLALLISTTSTFASTPPTSTPDDLYHAAFINHAINAHIPLSHETLSSILPSLPLFQDPPPSSIQQIPYHGNPSTKSIFLITNSHNQSFILKQSVFIGLDILESTTVRNFLQKHPLNTPNTQIILPLYQGCFPSSHQPTSPISPLLIQSSPPQPYCFSIMPKAPGASFLQLIQDFNANLISEDQLSHAFFSLGQSLYLTHLHGLPPNSTLAQNNGLSSLVHSDLHTQNIFFDPSSNLISFIDSDSFSDSIESPLHIIKDINDFLIDSSLRSYHQLINPTLHFLLGYTSLIHDYQSLRLLIIELRKCRLFNSYFPDFPYGLLLP